MIVKVNTGMGEEKGIQNKQKGTCVLMQVPDIYW